MQNAECKIAVFLRNNLKFALQNEPGGPNGVTIISGLSGPNCPWGHPHKLELGENVTIPSGEGQ